ncbi:ExbD/TolR family protein [Halocynthiibacter styelae]|uniref:Biopolymer transporter ExbD n=1 Tax=Halocynthiibacter styelae TaxID=2761955 RepID=A0A8J7IYP0_9RHOB|nr:biopolymer transporter ExbD [Paenihalocynthiibacter styelae]MBI1494659.1 biopolymer transporter ExbD [Paenihalocynthiibacter styelae]
MRLRGGQKRKATEPTIALINVVFLMLIFFLIAGTVSPPLDDELKLVNVEGLEGRPPPDTLILHADGHLSLRGAVVLPEDIDMSELPDTDENEEGQIALRLIPDRDVSAMTLLKVTDQLRLAGATQIWLVTERGLQ